MSGIVSVGAAEFHVFLDALDVEVHNRLLAFVGEQEFQGFFAVHEAVLRQAGCAGGFVEDGEVGFLVRISVAVIEAHPMTGQDLEGGHNSAGDFAVVRPFKETAVRGALSCSFLAVSVVNKNLHRTQSLGCRSADQR